jgi:NADPH-dependent FMN reductase
MTKPHIQIIRGSTRDERRGPPIARWFAAIAAEREDITTELLDLAEFDLPFLSGATPPMTLTHATRRLAAGEQRWPMATATSSSFPSTTMATPLPSRTPSTTYSASGVESQSDSCPTADSRAVSVRSSNPAGSQSSSTWCRSAAKWRSRGSGRQSTRRALYAHPFPYKRRNGCSTTSELGRPPFAPAALQSQPHPHDELLHRHPAQRGSRSTMASITRQPDHGDPTQGLASSYPRNWAWSPRTS